MKHTLILLVRNEFGVLSRVANLFSARGYNIESLNVAPTLDPSVSRMTIVTSGDDKIIEQINKQTNKLISTIKVSDVTEAPHVEREMVLVKVKAAEDKRAEALRIADIFRGKVIDVSPASYTIEFTGSQDKVDAAIELLRPLGIKELVRTGVTAISRGAK